MIDNEINTFFDFCSGIGGGRLGLEKIGLKCVGYCDTSKLAKKTYDIMFNPTNEKYFYNIRTLKLDKLPPFDLLIAGFPCQSFSVIGRKEGFNDIRGQIIFNIAHILKIVKPKCFILENVKGLVTHDKGNTLKIIINTLEESGYAVTYKVLTSSDYGVPQMRKRIYIIGINKSLGINIDLFTWPEPSHCLSLSNFLVDHNYLNEEEKERLSLYLKNTINNGKYSIEDLQKIDNAIFDTRMNDLRIYKNRCPTLRAQRDGLLYSYKERICKLTGYEALLLQGFPQEYANKVKNIVSDRHLLMQAGNAMTVPVISKIGMSILELINNEEDKK